MSVVMEWMGNTMLTFFSLSYISNVLKHKYLPLTFIDQGPISQMIFASLSKFNEKFILM